MLGRRRVPEGAVGTPVPPLPDGRPGIRYWVNGSRVEGYPRLVDAADKDSWQIDGFNADFQATSLGGKIVNYVREKSEGED
jgi:hypothetical protein